MILPDVTLPSRQGIFLKNGIDDIEFVNDKTHFLKYKHRVEYQFNSRGFRDSEWPLDTGGLHNSIWCIGDSFTVGLGSPYKHIWPQILQNKTGTRTINVSMDGASNNWISRKIQQIVTKVAPKNIVILWSYFHRRENPNTLLNDEQRRIYECNSTDQEDCANFINCVDSIKKYSEINFVQFIVPNAQSVTDIKLSWDNFRGPDWPVHAPYTMNEFNSLPGAVKHEIVNRFDTNMAFRSMLQKNDWTNQYKLKENIIEVSQLDHARDGHHFDINTSEWLVEQILPRLVI
jgi:hypothetical protein